MFKITVTCQGVSEMAAQAGIADILEEFATRTWHENVSCCWDGERIVLVAENDYDSNGKALLDEFSDVICACLPIEPDPITFVVESVSEFPGSNA